MKPPLFSYNIDNDVENILLRLGTDINAFRHKRVLVTGGTGFFGRWLLQVLCTLIKNREFELEVYVITRNSKYFLATHTDYPFHKYINFINGDVRNFTLPSLKFDYLIHMATTSAGETFDREDQLKKINLLYEGTQNVLKNSIAAGVENVLFTSSGIAYGPSENGKKFREDYLGAPYTLDVTSALGEGKRLAEYLVAYYASQLHYKFNIARCFSFAGQFLPTDIHYAFGNFIRDAMNGTRIKINGSGSEIRSYLFIGDAIVWLMKALIHPKNEIYNVGSSKEISIRELAVAIESGVGNKVGIDVMGKGITADNFSRNMYVPDNIKFRLDFGVDEWTSLDEIIQKMKIIK